MEDLRSFSSSVRPSHEGNQGYGGAKDDLGQRSLEAVAKKKNDCRWLEALGLMS